MSICQNSAHYPQLDLPAEYDARLHNYDTETPCHYRYTCALGHVTVRRDQRSYVLCAHLYHSVFTEQPYPCRRHAK